MYMSYCRYEGTYWAAIDTVCETMKKSYSEDEEDEGDE